MLFSFSFTLVYNPFYDIIKSSFADLFSILFVATVGVNSGQCMSMSLTVATL